MTTYIVYFDFAKNSHKKYIIKFDNNFMNNTYIKKTNLLATLSNMSAFI